MKQTVGEEYRKYSDLESMHFKYECLCSMVSCLWLLLTEGPVEVKGLPEHSLEYSLYEIEMGIRENNKELKKWIDELLKTDREGEK